MAKFTYDQYADVVARAQEGGSSSKKIGWLKLNEGGEALVRFNVSSVNDLSFNSIHQLSQAANWMKVSCLNTVGSTAEQCPLCAAVAAGNTAIGKSLKKVYVQVLVAYKDAATGTFSEPIPVIWERPASFSRDIATMLRDYGDLRQVLLKISRTGNGLDTRYSITYAVPTIFSPDLIPTDFSAFDNFDIAKHSYWDKSRADIEAFLATGSFPEVARPQQAPTPTDADAPAYTRQQPAYAVPQQQPMYAAPQQPAYAAPQQPVNTVLMGTEAAEEPLPFTMGGEPVQAAPMQSGTTGGVLETGGTGRPTRTFTW